MIHQSELFLFFGAYVVIIIILFCVNIALCVWVYRDARSRGKDGALWVVIVLVAGCLGLIIYLIIRDD